MHALAEGQVGSLVDTGDVEPLRGGPILIITICRQQADTKLGSGRQERALQDGVAGGLA